MFYRIVVLSGLVAVLSAAALEPVQIISQSADIKPDGSFEWNYESADGSKHEQRGSVKQVDKEVVTVIEGTVSWTDPERNHHEISYTADENGFQARSADLPVAPEIPKAIARALEWIAAHPEPQNKH